LQPGVQVIINGQQQCEHVQLHSKEQLRCEIKPLVFVAQYLSEQVTGVYLNVTVLNPDGGFEIMQDAFFATNDCPMEGIIPYHFVAYNTIECNIIQYNTIVHSNRRM